MYRPETDPDKAQRQANLLLMFVLGILVGAGAIAIIAISRCETSDQSQRVVSTPTTREVTRVIEVTREVQVTREVEVEVRAGALVEVEVTQEIEVPVEITREVEVTRIVPLEVTKVVEVPVEVTREVELPVEVTREVEVTRVVVVTATPIASPTSTPIPELPSTPAELVEQVQQSVVRVKARSGGTIFGRTSAGSGFIFAVDGTTAFVTTNHHVIDGKSSVEVQLKNSETYDALILGWDADRDVAVLSICCSSDFVALPWGDASPSEGETVIAIGYPDNDTGNLITTIGEVRALDDLSIEHGYIPHSAPLNPGNSGGPLFSMPGAEVVGINTARGTETLAFYAVPYQAIAQQVAEWRSQLIVPPTATPIFTSGDATSELATSFGPGTYIVGKDIAPGEYRAKSKDGNTSCEWKRLNALDGEQKSTIDSWWLVQTNEGYTYATIRPTDFAFSSEGCAEWESTNAIHSNPMPSPNDKFDGGTHLVNIHIQPGLYRSEVAETGRFSGRCSWTRLRSTDGYHSSKIALNGIEEGTVYATIKPTDYAFHSRGCTTWVKQ